MSNEERTAFVVNPDGEPIRLNLGPIDGTESCDFCNHPDVVHGFECPTFSIERKTDNGKSFTLGSDGDWAACPVCRDLIFAGKREELLARAWELSEVRKAMPVDIHRGLRETMKMLHDNFWSKKTGKHYIFTPVVN